MKKLLILIFMLVTLTLMGEYAYVVNSVSGTLSRIDLEAGTTNNTFVQLGTTPNLIDIYQDYAFVVNSGDNSIQKIDLISGNTISNIYIEDSANPWYAKVKGDYLYVTGFFTNKLYKIDLTTEEIVAQALVGEAPEGIEFYQDKIYVSCTGGYVNNYQGSEVTVLSEANLEIIANISTSLNPQYINLYNEKLYVMCTGNWVDVMGKINVIDPETNTITSTLNVGGNIGKAVFINNRGYITDAMNTGIYVIDTENATILNDSTNPLTPGGSTIATNGSQIAFVNASWGSNGTLWITDSNLANGVSYEVALSPSDVIFGNQIVPNSEYDIHENPFSVTAYPNPSPRGVNFALKGNTRGENQVMIYNLKGQLVDHFTSTNQDFRWEANNTTNHNYANGIYFYKIINDNNSVSGKFIILKP